MDVYVRKQFHLANMWKLTFTSKHESQYLKSNATSKWNKGVRNQVIRVVNTISEQAGYKATKCVIWGTSEF